MSNTIFGIPILVMPMPNHKLIKEKFLPLLKDSNNFSESKSWDCNCSTTMLDEDKNAKFPWDIFFQNVFLGVKQYMDEAEFDKGIFKRVSGTAWANRYIKNQHQEVHAHEGDGNVISCAYMLDLPNVEGIGEFCFYNSTHSYFPPEMLLDTTGTSGKRYNPSLKDGDIVFFPSKLDHYVTYNKTDKIRATISANFAV
mgnify:CR=1 FL=1